MTWVKCHIPQVSVSRNNSNSFLDLRVLSLKNMYHHKSWGCTSTNLFGVLHKSHIFPHRAPSGAGVGISRLRPSMESYGPPAVILQLYPVHFCYRKFNCGKCEMDLTELKGFGPSLHLKALLVELGGMNVVLWGMNSLCILMHMFKN